MPLVLLLTGTVPAAPGRALTPADLLVDGLLELLVVQDGPHLAVAVAGPEGGGHLCLGLAHVSSAQSRVTRVTRHVWRDSLGVVLVRVAGELCLSPHPLCLGGVCPGHGLHVHHLLQCALQHVTPEPLKSHLDVSSEQSSALYLGFQIFPFAPGRPEL